MTEFGIFTTCSTVGGNVLKSSFEIESGCASVTTTAAPGFKSILFSLPESMICAHELCKLKRNVIERTPPKKQDACLWGSPIRGMFFAFIGNTLITVSKGQGRGNAILLKASCRLSCGLLNERFTSTISTVLLFPQL